MHEYDGRLTTSIIPVLSAHWLYMHSGELLLDRIYEHRYGYWPFTGVVEVSFGSRKERIGQKH